MNRGELKQLAQKYLTGASTEEEKELLHQWYDATTDGEVENIQADASEEQVKQRILFNLQKSIRLEKKSLPVITRRDVSVKRILLQATSVAAILLMGLFISHPVNKRATGNKTMVSLCSGKMTMSACSKMGCNGKKN
jgi:transmembrane sensor